ncbi:MAG: cation transporting ATPase C-terminal domain-containing protein, partial [Phycisphaerales bacterium]
PEWAPELLAGGTHEEQLQRCRAMAFTLLAVSPLFHAFNCRSRSESALKRPFSNRALWLAIAISFSVHAVTILVPGLHPVFKTYLLAPSEWAVVLVLAFLPIPIFEVIKLGLRVTRGAAAPR